MVFFATTPSTFAQTPTCTVYYGGGEVNCDATVSAATKPTVTATPAPATGSASNQTGQMTKGGLPAGRQDQPVYPPAPAKETPATGPEAFALALLIPAAAAGWYLRRQKQLM